MDNLEDLQSLVTSTDAQVNEAVAVDTPVDPNAPPPPPSIEEQMRDGVNMLFGMAIGYCAELKNNLNAQVADAWVEALVPVAQKYNWSMTSIPCELVAAVVILPTTYSCIKVVAEVKKREREEAKKEQKQVTQESTSPDQAMSPQMALYTQ